MIDIKIGDCRDILKTIPSNSVNCCVTSPPYFNLRDYNAPGQIGREKSPEEYINELAAVFEEVKRVLKPDGTLFLNLGDSYGKGKQILGIPWRVAFALQADGWYLRQDIIWQKNNPMPESVRDRCTKAHEYIFLLAKSQKYFFDNEAIKEPSVYPNDNRKSRVKPTAKDFQRDGNKLTEGSATYTFKNKRSVWLISTKPYKGAHFATFPPKLAETCILAGCPADGVVLDPFAGSGTVGEVCNRLNRNAILIELNPAYEKLIFDRVNKEARP